MRKVSDIKPYVRNQRLNDQAVDAVAASIHKIWKFELTNRKCDV
jgi:hypothetical protein